MATKTPIEDPMIDPRTGDVVGAVAAPYVVTSTDFHFVGTPIARDVTRGLVVLRVDQPLRVAYTTTGLYSDTWTGPKVTYTRYACTGGTLTVHVLQDPSLFRRTQTVTSGGTTFRVHGSRTIVVPLTRASGDRCTATFTIAPTRMPAAATGDKRHLGVHFNTLTYRP